MTLRLLIDECLPRQISDALVAEGHDCLFASAEFASQADDLIAAHAQRIGRIIVTEDDDFGELAVRWGVPTPGIVFADMPNLPMAERVARVIGVAREYGDDLRGHLTTVGSAKVRRRAIPG